MQREHMGGANAMRCDATAGGDGRGCTGYTGWELGGWQSSDPREELSPSHNANARRDYKATAEREDTVCRLYSSPQS